MIDGKGNSSEDCKVFSDFSKKYFNSRPKKESRYANSRKKQEVKYVAQQAVNAVLKKIIDKKESLNLILVTTMNIIILIRSRRSKSFW